MNGLFTWDLGKGEHSRILSRKTNVNWLSLVYNPKEHRQGKSDIPDERSCGANSCHKKPDIVLQLTKKRFARRNENDLSV